MLLVPCPQSNDYQDIYELECEPSDYWDRKSISENQNEYLQFLMQDEPLAAMPKNFSVSYSFIHKPKSIDIDFTPLKNPDGSWKDLPEYDETTEDYENNTEESGEYVDPYNETIQAISKKLIDECGGNKMAYAYRCYTYVAANYRYLNPLTGMHPLKQLLAWGGGDCGNLSSIYISLLRAQEIPARHVVALGANETYHVWSEFYVQDFGWIPVDVTFKNSAPDGDFFGKCNPVNLVVMQKGVAMDYYPDIIGKANLPLMQTVHYWYSYKDYSTMSVKQTVTSTPVEYSGIDATELQKQTPTARKVIRNRKLLIQKGNKTYRLDGTLY